jgi:hypothetical protein
MRRNHLTRTALALLLAVMLVGCQDLNVRQPDAHLAEVRLRLVQWLNQGRKSV